MPSKRRRAVPARATRAEVAAYANAHPEELESLGEMLSGERAEYVARRTAARPVGRPNDLPQQPHGDSLREELSDLLGMLDDACMLLAEGNALEAANELPAARALLQSILGAI